MKNLRPSLAGLGALAVLCLAPFAYAVPVGTFSCKSSNGNDTNFNVSYFAFGITDSINIGSGSAGGGAGKATFQPLEVHAALSTFALLENFTIEGAAFETCTLTSTASDGTTVTFTFKNVAIKALSVVGEQTSTTETPAQYTDVQLEYLQVAVKTSGGTDDGGTTRTPTASRNSNDDSGH